MRSGRGGPKVIVFSGMLMSTPEMSLSQLALTLYGIKPHYKRAPLWE
jgi:hypothetical protein